MASVTIALVTLAPLATDPAQPLAPIAVTAEEPARLRTSSDPKLIALIAEVPANSK